MVVAQVRFYRTVLVCPRMGPLEGFALRPVLECFLICPFGEDDILISFCWSQEKKFKESGNLFHPFATAAKRPFEVGLVVSRNFQPVHRYVHACPRPFLNGLPFHYTTSLPKTKKPQTLQSRLRLICCSSIMSISKVSCKGSFGSTVKRAATAAMAQRTDWYE